MRHVEELPQARVEGDLAGAVLRSYLPSITASTLVAMFLLVIVITGLTGVSWRTVTQRTREIGLRRGKRDSGRLRQKATAPKDADSK